MAVKNLSACVRCPCTKRKKHRYTIAKKSQIMLPKRIWLVSLLLLIKKEITSLKQRPASLWKILSLSTKVCLSGRYSISNRRTDVPKIHSSQRERRFVIPDLTYVPRIFDIVSLLVVYEASYHYLRWERREGFFLKPTLNLAAEQSTHVIAVIVPKKS